MPQVTMRSVKKLDGLLDLRDRLEKGSPEAMQAVSEALLESADYCFETSTDPWGRPWKPHSDVTLQFYAQGGFQARTRDRRGRGARPRRQVVTKRYRMARRKLLHGPTAQLRALVPRWTPKTASVSVGGQARAYGHVHQFGNPDNRLPNRAGGARAPIPARPFFPLRLRGSRVHVDLPPELAEEVVETIRDALLGGL